MAQLEFLKVYKQDARYDDLLNRALANPNASPQEVNCLKVYKALELRKAGQKEAGLKLLQEVAPSLTIREASDEETAKVEGGVACFVLGKGQSTFGIVSSSADARLTCETMAWLSGLQGDIPSPHGLDTTTLDTGAVALAVVLNRVADAGPWIDAFQAVAGDQGFKRAATVLADALVMRSRGKHAEALNRLIELLANGSHKSFAPLVGVLAYETAKLLNDDQKVAAVKQLALETFGDRYPPELKARLN